jgi:NADPH:quinone reductase
MRATVLNEYGEPEKLVSSEMPLPQPGAGEVRVKVAATGVNFIDTYQRRGLYPKPLPLILGEEFAGTVDALGEGVESLRLGQRVATANGRGGYAEYALAGAAKMVSLPASVSFEQAAALMLQGMTAHYLAVSTFPLSAGHTALVHAAAGGVGQLLLQIAKLRGARVLATVSTSEKARIAQQLGADEIINYAEQDFQSEVMRLTNQAGVDVVYDGVGQATFLKDLDCLKVRGCLVLYGQASGPVSPIDPQLLNRKGSLFLTRPTLGHYTLTSAEIHWRASELFHWLESGELKLSVDQSFPLAQAALAHRYLEGRQTKGKVLLMP